MRCHIGSCVVDPWKISRLSSGIHRRQLHVRLHLQPASREGAEAEALQYGGGRTCGWGLIEATQTDLLGGNISLKHYYCNNKAAHPLLETFWPLLGKPPKTKVCLSTHGFIKSFQPTDKAHIIADFAHVDHESPSSQDGQEWLATNPWT